MKFLKNFGLGLVTIILLPFFLLVLALYAVYLLVIYFIELARNLVRFFKGEKGLRKLPEDLKVEAIKKKNLEETMAKEAPKEEAKTPQAPPGPTHVYVQQNYYQQNPSNPAEPSLGAPSTPSFSNSNFQNNHAIPELNPQTNPQNFIDSNPFGDPSSPSLEKNDSPIEGGHNP